MLRGRAFTASLPTLGVCRHWPPGEHNVQPQTDDVHEVCVPRSCDRRLMTRHVHQLLADHPHGDGRRLGYELGQTPRCRCCDRRMKTWCQEEAQGPKNSELNDSSSSKQVVSSSHVPAEAHVSVVAHEAVETVASVRELSSARTLQRGGSIRHTPIRTTSQTPTRSRRHKRRPRERRRQRLCLS